LPRAALAGIIIVALKGMLMQVRDLRKFQREGFLEMTVWITTFIVVVVVDIDIGLLTGVLVSLVALYLKGFKSYSCLLGQVTGTDIYIDIKTHRGVEPIPDIKIFHYVGSINFASRGGFKKDLFTTIGVDAKAIRRASISDSMETRGLGRGFKTLIIDLSAVAHLDTSGCKMLAEIKNNLKIIGVKCFLANASDCVYDSLVHASQIGEPSFEVFSTVHDAVLFAQKPASLNEV
jgi:solute carrier family 26, other